MGKPTISKEFFFIQPEMKIPAKYACTGDVNILREYLSNNPIDTDGNPISDEAMAYLLGKIENMEYINNQVKDMNNQKVQPKKAIKYGENGLILDLPHQPVKQSTACGCWAMPAVMMLQSRGVMIDQDIVKNYRPEISKEASEKVLPEDYHMMNSNTFSNISFSAGLIHKFIPNSALSQIKYRKTSDPKQTLAASSHLNTKIREALSIGSPVALLFGNHYRTIVGIDGDTIIFKDSNTETPDLNEKANLSAIINSLDEGHTIEISYLKDISANKEKDKIPEELNNFKTILRADGNGGYKPYTSEELQKAHSDRNADFNQIKALHEQKVINDEEFEKSKVEFEKASSTNFMVDAHTEDHLVLGHEDKINLNGVEITIGETLHISNEINTKAKYIKWNPDELSELHWTEEIKNNPEIKNTLLNNITNEPLTELDDYKIDREPELQPEPQKKPEPQQTQQVAIYNFRSGASIVVNPDQSVSFNPSEGDKTPTKPNIENLNNPPLETGKSIDIEKFRELEKKTVFGKDYDKMFEREYEYVKSLPDGPLKKMTEMSIDARNAIKVLSNDPTPQNKADMREYAKIIVAQKLLAIEHACSNGMGVTEKGLEENDARGFLSDALVTKLTDQVIDFSKPDYINQLDDFLTSDKGLDKITAFVKESVENTKKLDIEQKKQLNNKVDIAMDNEHSIDLLKNLSNQLGDLKPNMVSNKPGLDNLKKAIDNAINLRTELGYSTDDLDTKKKIERSEKIKNAYSDIKDAALKYAKVNASGQTVNEKGEPVFNSKLSGVEVGLMFDAGKLSENVIENEVEKQIFLNAQLEKEQRLEEEKIRRQKEADEILANTYKIDITQEKSKLESDFDVINKIRDYGNKTISYRDRIIYVAERFGTTLNSQSNLFYEQPNLLNVFDAQLCVLGANPALFSELEKTIQGGEKMSDRELKTAFVDNMLNDSNYLKRPEMKRFVDEVLRPEFDKNKILLKQNSEGMQDYMHETMKSISVASQTEPYTDMKATLLNDCMDTAKNVIRKSADYRVLAKPFLKNEKLTDQINGAYYYNDLRIRGNDARNKILNNHIPGEQINHNILLDYVAGQVAGAMKEPVKKDSLANNKIPYSNVFEEFGMKNSQYAQGVFKTILSKSNTFNKLCQQNPDKIRDAIVLGDKSFTRVGAQIINEMKDIARVEKDNIIKSYGGTKVKNAPNNDNFGPKTNM